ncbi:MAG: putative Fe-S cluster assembly protein SufT [Mariprofundaceae bacterium]
MITIPEDCPAALVPLGTHVTLPAGSQVMLTQQLGGSLTVNINGNLARIDAADALRLGLSEPPDSAAAPLDEITGPLSEDQVWQVLATCYDPEIPVNIVELGLIYDLEIIPGDSGARINVDMTLTAPGCGMGPFIAEDVRYKLQAIPGVVEADVRMVFDPPWDRSMMSETAQLELGLF